MSMPEHVHSPAKRAHMHKRAARALDVACTWYAHACTCTRARARTCTPPQAGDLEFEFMHHFFDTLFLSSFSATGLAALVAQYFHYRRLSARHAERALASASKDELVGVSAF